MESSSVKFGKMVMKRRFTVTAVKIHVSFNMMMPIYENRDVARMEKMSNKSRGRLGSLRYFKV